MMHQIFCNGCEETQGMYGIYSCKAHLYCAICGEGPFCQFCMEDHFADMHPEELENDGTD